MLFKCFALFLQFSFQAHAQMAVTWGGDQRQLDVALPAQKLQNCQKRTQAQNIADYLAAMKANRPKLSEDWVLDNLLECEDAAYVDPQDQQKQLDQIQDEDARNAALSKMYRRVPSAVIPALKKRVAGKIPEAYKADGSRVTTDDLIKIDLLSRALLAEMGSAQYCSDEEVMALGKVLRNRSTAVEDKKRVDANFSTQATYPPWLSVMTSPYQIQAMDGTSMTAACPAAPDRQFDLNGKYSAPVSIKLTQRTARVAMQMVLDPKGFDKETAEVDDYLYTKQSPTLAGWQKKSSVTKDARIHGKIINNPNCIQTWRPKAGA